MLTSATHSSDLQKAAGDSRRNLTIKSDDLKGKQQMLITGAA